MGQVLEKFGENCSKGVSHLLTGARKRRRNEVDDNAKEKNNAAEEAPCAKKKKLQTTTQYIYQALFKEQINSDIAVMVLGKIWHLHKIYLSQSPYFYSMFNGSWRESCEKFVHIQIEDEHITVDAVDAVFGALYSDEIDVTSKNVIPILAAATLFHMESIIERCGEVMAENINRETSIEYYECACQYGCVNVKKKAFEWLEIDLLRMYQDQRKLLQQIGVELMTELVSSAELFVLQSEFNLYCLLRTWIYLRLHPDFDPDKSQSKPLESGRDALPIDTIRNYFVERSEQCPFLATSEGQTFIKPFQKLRTQYLSMEVTDLKIVLADNIIPQEWIHRHVLSQWMATLKSDHLPDEGPENLESEIFSANCMRCARSLQESDEQNWHLNGFNFGLDLKVILDSRLLSIRRIHKSEHERLLSLKTRRQIMVRASVASINEEKQTVLKQSTEILSLSLQKNEQATIMLLDQKLVKPLLISVNFLVVPPMAQAFKEQLIFPSLPPAADEAASSSPISEIGTKNVPQEITTPHTSERITNTSNRIFDVLFSPSTSSTTYAAEAAVAMSTPSRPRLNSAYFDSNSGGSDDSV